MATTAPPASLHGTRLRGDVLYMSEHLLGMPYAALKAMIYPTPPYHLFVLSKRNGSLRPIAEPRRRLKLVQERVLHFLYEHALPLKPCVHGFAPGRSILTNAQHHCSLRTHHVLNIDLESFFPSISFFRVRGIFQKQPFNCSYHVATVLAHLCTYKGALPQGAPTSPMLANLACRSLDTELMKLAKRHRSRYTRYADDLTFSFSVRRSENLPRNICAFEGGRVTIGEELHGLIERHSFRINANKTRVSTRLRRIEVTGLTINEFPNVKRQFVDRIRGALHAWQVYGYDLAEASWKKHEAKTDPKDTRRWVRDTRTGRLPALKNILWGKLLYLRMIRGENDVIYARLADRYNDLCRRERAMGDFEAPSLPVEFIVRTRGDCEEATFVVEWSGDYVIPGGGGKTEVVMGQGTAFAFSGVGFVTCEHVLRYHGEIGGIPFDTKFESTSVINKELRLTNPSTGVKEPATIIARDAGYDLAIVRFANPTAKRVRGFVVMSGAIEKDALGTLIGFPNYSPGKPATFLSERVITRYTRSALQRFDITGSGSIRQGNSGGPFVNTKFQLAGVAQQGATHSSGNDECLCITELVKWMESLGLAPGV